MSQADNVPRKSTIWNKSFILVLLVGVLTTTVLQILSVTLTPYANYMWNSKTIGGYLTSFFNAGSIIMSFFSGPLVDKKGRRWCLLAAVVVFIVPTLLGAFSDQPAVIMIMRVCQGMAKGLVGIASMSAISDVVPRERITEGMSLNGIGNTIAMAIGPTIGLSLTADNQYGRMFIVCCVLYFIAGLIALGLDYEKDPEYIKAHQAAPKKADQPADPQYKGIWVMLEKAAFVPAICHTIYFASYSCLLVYLSLYAQEVLGLNATQTGLFYTIAAVTMLIMRIFGGRISDKFGPMTIVVPCHILVIVLMLMMAYVVKGNYAAYLVSAGIYGIIFSTVSPALNAVAVVDSPKNRTGVANATFAFFIDFGIVFTSPIFGNIIDNAATPEAGYVQIFMVSIGICVFSLILALVLLNDKARARRRARYGVQDPPKKKSAAAPESTGD
jgi:MFS family permease